MFPLIFSDLISLTVVVYVLARIWVNPSLEPEAVKMFRNIGFTLIAAIALDHIWEYCFELSGESDLYRGQLQLIASSEFLSIPVSLFFIIWYHRKKRDLADGILIAGDLVLFVLDLANAWVPVYFYLDEDYYVANCRGAGWIHLFAVVLTAFVLIHDIVHLKYIDYENLILIIFVLLTAALGEVSFYFDGNVTAVWECMAIVYLLLYLTFSRAFEKTDQVTGIPNRNAFTVAYFRNRRKPAAVLVNFDLNHLKSFNDRRGHRTGDRYLRAFAQTAGRRLEPYGRFYRVGGDEFCLVCASESGRLKEVLENLDRMEKCDPEFGDFPMNFSYGLVVRRPGETNEELYERADEKMYADKRRTEAADSDHPRGDQ